METGSADIWKDARKKKYHIYIEEYVMSYLRRESDSLELSEICFYGLRQENGMKFYVYGAGREKEIAVFAAYEPLPELVCRFTQAGPVFMVREPDGECRANGFEIFYDNNDAMQNYLLEWTGSHGGNQTVKKESLQEKRAAKVTFPEEKRRGPRSKFPSEINYRAISVQLCLILVALVAIVITSTDSYDEMEELNRSAREVFFAIENQEAEEPAGNAGVQEIVVERDIDLLGGETSETDSDESADESAQDADAGNAAEGDLQKIDLQEKDFGEALEEGSKDADSDEAPEGELREKGSHESADKNAQETDSDETSREMDTDVAEEALSQEQEENEEALSRSVTRYYEVEQGDTLYTISQKIYGDMDNSRVEKICEVNQITDPDRIRSGQRIILP